MRIRLAVPLLAAALSAAFVAGCTKAGPTADSAPRRHAHHPPHGGTPIVLGDEVNHIELVLDPALGVLQAYVLDDEMEEFVRCAAPSIEIDATVAGTPRVLVLAAVANPATGETVGDTSLFEAQADWLKAVHEFDGVIRSVPIHGTTFTGVKFTFPKGNDTDG
jgi:hypothetical protein